MTTWTEVASDAVKIGLGAFIAGLFALLGSSKAHKNKLDEEYSRRRRDSLEKIAEEFDRIAITGMERVANWLALHSFSQEKGASKIAAKIKTELNSDSPVLECLYNLHSVELKLALLGFPHISESVEKYRMIFSEIDFDASPAKEDMQKYVEMETALQSLRTIIVTLMAEAFQKS